VVAPGAGVVPGFAGTPAIGPGAGAAGALPVGGALVMLIWHPVTAAIRQIATASRPTFRQNIGIPPGWT
jgi:hypothetical protein